MRLAKLLHLLLIPTLLFAALSPLAVSASTGPADTAISLDDGLNSIDQDGEENANVGVGIALGIISLVLILVAIVAVIGAAALGIIGLGYWQSSAE